MATQPHPQEPPRQPPPPKSPEQELKEQREFIAKQSGEPVKTIADEQREGSAEMEKIGVEPWKQKWYKGPKDEDHPRQTPGVSPTSKRAEDEDDDGDDKSGKRRR